MLKTKWLMNFSSSYIGGGSKRLIETAKCFDKSNGGHFIIHQKSYNLVKEYSHNNVFYVVNPNRIRRLFNDGHYLKNILNITGTPEIYFSYGIPVFYKIGKINWFHISNALSLTTNKIDITPIQRLKMILLKHRILNSLDNVRIISGESEFSLNLLKSVSKNKFESTFFNVLPNGFNPCENKNIVRKVKEEEHYAITIGTLKYKKLSVAFNLFRFLQKKDAKLKKFYIIGNKHDLPNEIKYNENVVVDVGSNREDLIHLLSNAEYYISASQIENSSIAALEGLIFSKYVVLSDIPPHREMLKDIDFEELYIDGMNDLFLVANFESNFIPPNIHSWEQATFKFHEILKNFYNGRN
jgi:hypothetical protein